MLMLNISKMSSAAQNCSIDASSTKTLIQVTPLPLSEPLEAVYLEWWQDDTMTEIQRVEQIIPVIGSEFHKYEIKYNNESSVEYVTETKFISYDGLIDVNEFTCTQNKGVHDLWCLTVLGIRPKNSNEITILRATNKGAISYSNYMASAAELVTTGGGEYHSTRLVMSKAKAILEEYFKLVICKQ